ncbi:MAG: valine--tRNA ligase [Phycisphaerae bacterium]|nr:valine--tRNA ligase [Phycisphaerae bacterium]
MTSSPSQPPAPAAELPKQYRPADHEPRVWKAWESAGVFHADPARVLSGEARPYAVLIPPPNVTDRLHLGHALNNTLQDVLVRAHRMMGFETLWMPGTDHAGIATQAVVERRVWGEEKKRRTDLGREAFVARIQAFKDEYEAVITGQLKALGCSCDWARQRFTMDQQCARAVREAFFRMFRDGLIYRGKRLVNWDPVLQTAVADDECYDAEIDGSFWYLRYPLVHPHGATTAGERRRGHLPPEDAVPVTWSELEARGYPGAEQHPSEDQAWVTVATTRPETYLGDTAVAVNPKDPRAKPLHGLCVELPLVGRVIPIIEDAYVVLPKSMSIEEEPTDPKAEFATGFLKVTPAHDPNDYEIYQRHKERLDTFAGHVGGGLVNVMAPDGSISDKHGWRDVGDAHRLVGMKRDEARALVVKEFEARGLLEATRPYRHSVKHSDRSKAVIEPYLSDQWYCRVTDPRMAQAANAALAKEQRAGAPSSGGTGVPPARRNDPCHRPDPVSKNPLMSLRHLPHFQKGGSTYFITFRTAGTTTLTPDERRIALDACRHWHGTRMELHAAVVMDDHVHLLLSPFEVEPGRWHAIPELLHGIKSFSAHQIARSRGTSGSVWQDESFDRIVRGADELWEKLVSIAENPVEAGLVAAGGDYPFTFLSDAARSLRLEFADRIRGTREDRRDACPTKDTGDGSLRFHPARYAKTYEQWHDSIRDWCISRQLWWGHRIPVWSREVAPPDAEFLRAELLHWIRQERLAAHGPGAWTDLPSDDTGRLEVCPRDPDDEQVAGFLDAHGFRQDPDVLDTWFSSALWPMSTLGWPEDTPLLRAFNPTDTLCTARDIITLWVSRMVMFNRYLMPPGWGPRGPVLADRHAAPGPAPFRDVFIHALIMDGDGQRMSKSKGNGVDPLDIINSHGCDALRFSLCQLATQTQDVRLPVHRDPATGRNTSPKFDLGRNFCNKLWNATRFALGILARPSRGEPTPTLVDRWMLSRLAAASRDATAALDQFEFSVYAQTMYDLMWRDFCDWYLEAIKPTVDANPFQRAVLAHALETIVRLLHPITPFVTEAVWEHLRDVETMAIEGVELVPARKAGLLCTAGWPIVAPSHRDESAERAFERLRGVVTTVRELRARHDVPDKRRVTLHAPPSLLDELAALGPDLVRHLAGAEALTSEAPAGASVLFTLDAHECRLSNLADAVDPAAERARLDKVIADRRKTIATLEGRLANPGYADKAPPAMVQQTRDQLAKAREDTAAALAALDSLEGA